ncbi:chorismate mutase [Kitasatospora sp. NPDC056138]|uniref:chorismate mutase n=1 Tax=Kitasatospora sp. NPDC056138 TaxID=3345724 RepID=UPI0035D9CB70
MQRSRTTTAAAPPTPGPAVVRAIRGATRAHADEPALIEAATGELLSTIMDRNAVGDDDLISILFTVTPDLASAYPARAARELGLTEVPLMCATEIPVPGALTRVIRVLAHVHTSRPRESLRHVYLGGAAVLRPDLAAVEAVPTGPLLRGE